MDIARYEKRIISFVLDEIVALIPALIIGLIMYFGLNFRSHFLAYATIFVFVWYAFYIIINTLYLTFSNGFTLGSHLTRTRVVHRSKKKIGFSDSFIRSIMIGILPMVIINAFYMITRHTELTAFDRITDTFVIDNLLR